MPNHITNKISLRDDAQESKYDSNKEVFEKMTKFMKTEEREFDFNQLIPMPEELRNTKSPVDIVSEEDYKKSCESVDKHNSNVENAHWERKYPITNKMSHELIKKYEANNWYDWASKNWQTKWNAYSVHIDSWGEIFFQTAWATSRPILKALSEKFPTVEIEVNYADEDWGSNCGTLIYKNGEILFETTGNEDFAKALCYEMDYKNESKENKVLREEISKLKGKK